jgi:hypothetical protein
VGLATPSLPRAEAHERVELYFYSPRLALRACYRVNLDLYLVLWDVNVVIESVVSGVSKDNGAYIFRVK